MKSCVIIPAYNEEKNISWIIEKIRMQELDILVIDDGSKDRTGELAKKKGAIVLRNLHNQGKGASLLRGFNFALENNYDTIITMDADGQHLPEDIPRFLDYAKKSSASLIIGNRMDNTKEMPWLRVVTNKFMSLLISKLTKQLIPDSQCGFRLIKKEVLNKIRITTSHYETESEIILKAGRMGFKIESIPIKSIYNGKKSYIHPLIDSLRFIRLIIRYLWNTQS